MAAAIENHEEGVCSLSAQEVSDVLLTQALEAENVDCEAKPLIALVAHDNMKPLMKSFAESYADYLREFRLTGTGTTCQLLRVIGWNLRSTTYPAGLWVVSKCSVQ